MVKSRRNASSSGVPKVVSCLICRSPASAAGSGGAGLAGSCGSGGGRAVGPGRDVLAKRRDLDRLGAEAHVRQPEPASDDPAVPEQLLDLVRMGGGADVDVFRAPREEETANAPANEVGGVARLIEAIQHFERVGVDVPPRNRVLGTS